jgi:hypothetical protein
MALPSRARSPPGPPRVTFGRPSGNPDDGGTVVDQTMSRSRPFSVPVRTWLVLLTLLAVAAAVQAQAPRASAAEAASTSMQMTMQVDGCVVARQQRADGKLELTSSSGRKLITTDSPEVRALPLCSARRTPGTRLAPKNIVYGTCGSSYLYLDGLNLRYTYRTGFSLAGSRRAISYRWQVRVTGPFSYSRYWNWSGGLAYRQSWGDRRYANTVNYGQYTGRVVVANSWALLATGDICVSGGPSSFDFVY